MLFYEFLRISMQFIINYIEFVCSLSSKDFQAILYNFFESLHALLLISRRLYIDFNQYFSFLPALFNFSKLLWSFYDFLKDGNFFINFEEVLQIILSVCFIFMGLFRNFSKFLLFLYDVLNFSMIIVFVFTNFLIITCFFSSNK